MVQYKYFDLFANSTRRVKQYYARRYILCKDPLSVVLYQSIYPKKLYYYGPVVYLS